MSKDGKDVAADGTDDRPRRRRKGGGLRVPSDNVPRPTAQAAPELSAEPAEDPRLAVSVAYAFSDEDSSKPGSRSGRLDETVSDAGVTADSVDIDLEELEEERASLIDDQPTVIEPLDPPDYDEPEMVAAEAADEAPDAGESELEPDDAADEPRLASVPGGASAKGTGRADSRQWPRVQTQALSDADLEGMVVGEGEPSTVDLDAAELQEVGEEEVPTRLMEDSMDVPTIAMERDDGVPAAVASLEQSAIESPMAPRDAGDSGEILSDDLVEEIEGKGAAAADGAKKSPPPAPKGGGVAAAPVPAPEKSKRRKGKPWFEEIFDEDYLRTLPFLTPQTTQAEAAFVIDSLAAEAGSQILDVGCGYGRHAMELAARGYHVVGLDSSLPLLLRGADEAQRRGLNINFVHGDMRELSFDAQFDGAYCLFSTFGYFDDEANKRTAQNISRALKPGARLVIEVLNRDYIIGDLPSRVWWEGDGCVVLEEVEFNYFSSRILSHRSVVFDDGRQLEQEISIRAYSLHELGKLLHAAGFRVIEVSGGMHNRGRFFGGRSRDIVVVAERRPAKDRMGRAATESDMG